MTVKSKNKKRKYCKCGKRFRPKPYQRKCNACHDAGFWNTKSGDNLLKQVIRCKWQGQLEKTNAKEVLELIKLRNKYASIQIKDVSKQGCVSEFKASTTLNLELTHLYPASLGGVLNADNLIVAPKLINRANGKNVYPIGVSDTSGNIVGAKDCKQWVEKNNDLGELKKLFNLLPKNRKKPTDEYKSEQFTYDDVLKAEAFRLGFKLEQLGWSGWFDLLEGQLEKMSKDEIIKRNKQEMLMVDFRGQYLFLSDKFIENTIIDQKCDKDKIVQALNKEMGRLYPSEIPCDCELWPFCYCDKDTVNNEHSNLTKNSLDDDLPTLKSLGFITSNEIEMGH